MPQEPNPRTPTPPGSAPADQNLSGTLRPGGLGSLAQSARRSSLRSARGILLAIGVLSFIVNAVVMATARSQAKQEMETEIAALQRQGMIIDRAKLPEIEDRLTRIVQLVAGGFAAVGVVFVVCGLLVHTFPVGATALSLVLYLGASAITLYFNPAFALPGLVIKVIIVVALIKGLQAGLAYKREQAAELRAAFGGMA